MKISSILEIPSVKILLFMHEKGEVRYSELVRSTKSRGTLSLSLKELEEDGLIQRRVEPTKPVQSFYSLTAKGSLIANKLYEIRGMISS
jgi:DNA-binding HxlR family transcriptional regulator